MFLALSASSSFFKVATSFSSLTAGKDWDLEKDISDESLTASNNDDDDKKHLHVFARSFLFACQSGIFLGLLFQLFLVTHYRFN